MMKKYVILNPAGLRHGDRKHAPGTQLSMSDAAARYLLLNGQIERAANEIPDPKPQSEKHDEGESGE